jgi:hypothetical protein
MKKTLILLQTIGNCYALGLILYISVEERSKKTKKGRRGLKYCRLWAGLRDISPLE